ncbi:MAG: hypothetical protein QM500_00810 [Methylococcales bacterium]
MTEIDEGLREHEAKWPFREVKAKIRKIQYVTRIAGIVVPDHYKYTHESISCIAEITNTITGFMNAAIENPKQRAYTSRLIETIQTEQMKEFNYANEMLERILQQLYELGLDRDASTSDKIRFLLGYTAEDENLENIMRQALPNFQYALKSVIASQSVLQQKDIVINSENVASLISGINDGLDSLSSSLDEYNKQLKIKIKKEILQRSRRRTHRMLKRCTEHGSVPQKRIEKYEKELNLIEENLKKLNEMK